MTDDPITKATTRLSAIRNEIGTLQAEAREIENALAVMRRFGAAAPTSAPTSEELSELEVERIDTSKNPPQYIWQKISYQMMSQSEFEVLATRAMEEAERPITRTQLLRWMKEHGTPMPGTDASKNVGTKLWRAREKFINIRGSGYWFRDRPCPAVGYDPASTFALLDAHFSADETEDAANIPGA